MSHPLYSSTSNTVLRNLSSRTLAEGETPAQDVLDAIGRLGVGTRLNADASINANADVADLFAALGGVESQSSLNSLGSMIGQMQNAADALNQALFKERLTPYLQADNRSVQAAFSRRNNTSVAHMLSFILSFVHKDIKHPIRTLADTTGRNGTLVSNSTYSHRMDVDLTYSDEETGTYHTLLNPDQPANSAVTWNVYLEDTPLLRRYLRYIDHLASQHGVRLIYCPKTFGHLEELDSVSRPTWAVVGDTMMRQYRGPNNYRALFVSLSFVYAAFSPFTRVETEVQPGQRVRDAESMNYTPVVSEYLDAFVQVIKQLGAFSVCKIYYKASRTPERL